MRPWVYFDANIFIYVLDGQSKFTKPASKCLSGLGEDFDGLSSVISYGEVSKPGSTAVRFLDTLPGLQLRGVDHTIAKQAAKLRQDHGISLADAIHLATALVYKAEAFVTNDLVLAKKARGLIKFKTL